MISLLSLLAAVGAPATPQIHCEIRMRSWCINQGVSQIEMHEIQGVRIWALNATYLPQSSFVIIENKDCVLGLADQAKEIQRSKGTDQQGKSYLEISYSIRKDGKCSLSFQFPTPKGDPSDNAYTLMITSIRLCRNELCMGPYLSLDPRPAKRK